MYFHIINDCKREMSLPQITVEWMINVPVSGRSIDFFVVVYMQAFYKTGILWHTKNILSRVVNYNLIVITSETNWIPVYV